MRVRCRLEHTNTKTRNTWHSLWSRSIRHRRRESLGLVFVNIILSYCEKIINDCVISQNHVRRSHPGRRNERMLAAAP